MKTYDPYTIRIRRRQPSLRAMLALYLYQTTVMFVVLGVFLWMIK